jgi:hypothetical protein
MHIQSPPADWAAEAVGLAKQSPGRATSTNSGNTAIGIAFGLAFLPAALLLIALAGAGQHPRVADSADQPIVVDGQVPPAPVGATAPPVAAAKAQAKADTLSEIAIKPTWVFCATKDGSKLFPALVTGVYTSDAIGDAGYRSYIKARQEMDPAAWARHGTFEGRIMGRFSGEEGHEFSRSTTIVLDGVHGIQIHVGGDDHMPCPILAFEAVEMGEVIDVTPEIVVAAAKDHPPTHGIFSAAGWEAHK